MINFPDCRQLVQKYTARNSDQFKSDLLYKTQACCFCFKAAYIQVETYGASEINKYKML